MYCYGNSVFRHWDNPDKLMLNTKSIAQENYRISQTDSFIDEMNIILDKNNGEV